MRKVTLEELEELAKDARQDIWDKADGATGREPKIYLHWTAGHYEQLFDDYHISITGDGEIFVSTDDLSETLAHTYRRNTGSIGIALCCAYGATSYDLGSEPPTPKQIETAAQVVAVVAKALWLTIDRRFVMTHGEAADNLDGYYAHEAYGPQSTCERWDLQYLGTPDSPSYTTDYDDPATGGNVLRGKANWYANQNS